MRDERPGSVDTGQSGSTAEVDIAQQRTVDCWEMRPLGEIVELRRGHDLPKRLREPGDVPVIGSGGPAGFHSTAIGDGPGVVVGRAANLGVPNWVDGPYWPLNTTLYVTDFCGNDPRFVYYLFRSLDLTAYNSGSVQPMLNRNYVANLDVPLPELAEQQRIAGLLGALDDKIDVNQRIVTLLEAELLVSLRGQAARTLPFTDVVDVNPRRLLQRRTDAPYLGMADVPVDGALVPRPSNRPYTSGTRFMNGDTLMAKITPCLENGKTCFVDFLQPDTVGWGSTEFHVLTAKPGFPQALPYALARQPEVREHVIANMTGTSGRQRCPASAFDSLTVSVPDTAALREWGDLAEANLRTSRALLDESATLAELRDALLPKLLSGEIRVAEAEDELEEAGV